MSVIMVRAKVKPEGVAEVEEAVKKVFATLEQEQTAGVRYASARLPDGVTFVVLLELEEGIDNPLPGIPAFLEFQEGLKTWLAEPPTTEPLEVVGSYRFFS